MADHEFPLPTDVKSLAELNKITQDVAIEFARELIANGLDADALVPFMDNWQNYNKYFAHTYHQLIEDGKIPPSIRFRMDPSNGK